MILPSPLGWISAKQSPPIPVACGSITPRRAQAATAASAAVPPDFSTSIAVSAASGCDVATIAFWAWTVDRPARWKFLTKMAHFVVVSARRAARVYMAFRAGEGNALGGIAAMRY